MLGLFRSKRQTRKHREPLAAGVANRSGRTIRLLRSALPTLRGRYDAAVTTDGNRRHWAFADGLSADAAASPEVRRTLRNRARYEVANNSYAKGIVLTLANDVVGTGPRLQMLTDDTEANRLIEREFTRWANAVCVPEKLRTMRMARAESGEAFLLMTDNPGLKTSVQLDLRLIEADQITTPDMLLGKPNAEDGIVFDVHGNVVEYHVLKQHPGSSGMMSLEEGYDRIPAESMVHYFRGDRPGQSRGVPDITPALPLFAQLRRYTLAVLGAAETAADFAGVLYTDAPPTGEAEAVEPMDTIELEARALLTMPGGWKMGQVKAEQPSTTYSEFKKELLNEIARCMNMPFNVAAGNSAGYNYASGRLDHQTYYKAIRIEQAEIERLVLDRLLRAWLREAVLIEGLLPQWMRQRGAIEKIVFSGSRSSGASGGRGWFWDGLEHVDPAKEANAQATRLSSHTTTLAREHARQGRDWEVELRQRAKEKALMDELELTDKAAPGSRQHEHTGAKDDDD